jgi:hypothetical protein
MTKLRRLTGCTLCVFFAIFGAAVSAQDQAPASDPPVLAHEITFFPQLDLQRSLGADFYLRGVYDILAWEHFRGTFGASLSFTPISIDGYFLDLGIDDIYGTGLGAHIKLMGDQYPEYGRAANTIQPYVAWRWMFLDLAFGVTWRFLLVEPAPLWLMFYYDPFMVEAIFYFKIGTEFSFFDDFWTLAVSLSDQDEFYAGNFGAFVLRAGNTLRIDGHWSAFLDLLYRPSGTIALTAVNSAIAIRLGGRLEL